METQFLDWKHGFLIESIIFSMKAKYLDLKHRFSTGNTIFRLETKFSFKEKDLYLGK